MDKNEVVSVRLPGADLKKLQLLAQITSKPVGELIRSAVSNYINDASKSDDLRDRFLEMKKRNDDLLNELFGTSSPTPKVRRLRRAN